MSEGNFTWVGTDEPLTYNNWDQENDQEPNDFGSGEDCGVMHARRSFRWIDAPCTWSQYFICEYSL